MVYDEMEMLHNMRHPHIVRFHEWFESKVGRLGRSYKCRLLMEGHRINGISLPSWPPAANCSIGFAKRENSRRRMPLKRYAKCSTRSITCMGRTLCIEVCRTHGSRMDAAERCTDLKPENLLYLTREEDSQLVLADFGIAKMLESNQVLTTMAGSFGYAAPEVMEKRGHSKPVDLWSLGVITYTLLCGYSPFRSESMSDLIEECRNERVIFHPRYWADVSESAKDFIRKLLRADPRKRPTSGVSFESSTMPSPVFEFCTGSTPARLAQRRDGIRSQFAPRNPCLRCPRTAATRN